MKYIILLSIKSYWLLVPEVKRKNCLFRESCSRYVYRITFEQGFIKGLKAFKERFKKCRSGYKIINIGNSEYQAFELVDGSILRKDEASEFLIREFELIQYSD